MGKSKTPTVSVIIPSFNREDTIGRAIESALKQTFQNFEIIVVDDGSTDGTRAVVEGFRNPRIRYLHHKQNRGAAAARNTGIRAASGAYLAFLDSDDEWLPRKLAEQIALLEDPSADSGLICSGLFLVGNGSEQKYIHASVSSWAKQLHWTCSLSPGTTLVVRRECITKVGLLDEEFPRFEDWDWLLRLSNSYKMAFVSKPLARVHRGPLPTADVVEASTCRFLNKHDKEFRAVGWYYRHRVVSKHWLGLAYWFYRERQFGKGNHYLVKALLENPLQNPIRLIGLFFSVIDALLGTSIIPWALDRKLRLLSSEHSSQGGL